MNYGLFNQKITIFRRGAGLRFRIVITIFLYIVILTTPHPSKASEQNKDNLREIARIYLSALKYIFKEQKLVNSNDRKLSKSKLFGDEFVTGVRTVFKETYGHAMPDGSKERLISSLLLVMRAVMEDNRDLIYDYGLKFKGFIPAIFAYQLSARLRRRYSGLVIKFIGTREKTRNKMNYPDKWETSAMNRFKDVPSLLYREWYEQNTSYRFNNRRFKVDRLFLTMPMKKFCLNCHGKPKDNPLNKNKPVSKWTNIDITGFYMENWTMDDFGGGVSVVLRK